MTVAQFESRRLQGTRVNTLPQTQYGRLKCVTVAQFERRWGEGRGVKHLPLAQYGRLKCVTVAQFESRRGEGTRSQAPTAGPVWEAEMCDSCTV